MGTFYDGTKLLSMKDINGNVPEIFMCTTNRSAGKTTYFNRLMINRFLKTGKKFILLYRFNYELDDVPEKFFKDIGSLFFEGKNFTSKRMAAGCYHDLYLDYNHCGYALAMNQADIIRKYSHIFSDADAMLFDEFQSETGHYCGDEITKFISVHMSVSRGQGKQSRYVPVYMISNCVTILNPYYVAMGISDRLQANTVFLRGDGWILENGFVESASSAQKDSLFNRAFASHKYIAYSAENVYLNDSKAFIEKINGDGRYVATIRYEGEDYSIKSYLERGIMYCDDKCDPTFPLKITVTTDDHQINYVMLKHNSIFLNSMRDLFSKGAFRFKNMKCKNAILKALSY